MENNFCKGLLKESGGKSWIEGDDGVHYFEGLQIWSGYLRHWTGRMVNARLLDKCDYEAGNKIAIIWPDTPQTSPDFFELYYNERLVKYPVSICGHNAINVSGKIYNYSHVINENEVMTPEEYFYRPALGEFAPSPVTGKADLSDPARPYYDKFGRAFMRTIHVLRVEGIDTVRLDSILRKKLEHIHALTPPADRPDHNPEFHWRKRNCTTSIAESLREYGLGNVTASFPRDLFVSASYACRKKYGIAKIKIFTMPQLIVDEAPLSKRTMMINPLNYIRYCIINHG